MTGLPGAGKSKRLIEAVNDADQSGRGTSTFVCGDYPWPTDHEAYWVHRRIVCGEPGLTCPIDHFVSSVDAVRILATLGASTLVAVEEAYAFGTEITKEWIAFADRGGDVLLAAPSDHQLRALGSYPHFVIDLALMCQRCSKAAAVEAMIVPEGNGALSVCAECFDALKWRARQRIAEVLRAEQPFPGEDALYQPVEVPELQGWRVARWDSVARASAALQVLTDVGVASARDQLTYLDVGCNTGLFADYFARHGFDAKGIDATHAFIEAARLLEVFFRRKARPDERWVRYELANAYEYLRDTQHEKFDVTSSFAVLQWIMIQRTMEHGLQCIEWLSEKTRRVCFIEFGYTREEMYRHELEEEIDRTWVITAMLERGHFDRVLTIDATPGRLQRDIFVGVKG